MKALVILLAVAFAIGFYQYRCDWNFEHFQGHGFFPRPLP